MGGHTLGAATALALSLSLVVSVVGCGRSDRTVITEYCRAIAYCGIKDWTANDVNACVEENLEPTGTEREQCLTRERTVCLGDCFHRNGCAIFDQNDPCSCERKDFGCPE